MLPDPEKSHLDFKPRSHGGVFSQQFDTLTGWSWDGGLLRTAPRDPWLVHSLLKEHCRPAKQWAQKDWIVVMNRKVS